MPGSTGDWLARMYCVPADIWQGCSSPNIFLLEYSKGFKAFRLGLYLRFTAVQEWKCSWISSVRSINCCPQSIKLIHWRITGMSTLHFSFPSQNQWCQKWPSSSQQNFLSKSRHGVLSTKATFSQLYLLWSHHVLWHQHHHRNHTLQI